MAEKSTGLLDSDPEEDEPSEERLVINKKYAKDFERRKQTQELRNAEQEGLLDESRNGSSEEDESSEDEDGDLLTTKMDTDIMRTLNALRSKNKEIYDPDATFFDISKPESDDLKPNKKMDKRKRYKDVVREQILEDMENGAKVADAADGGGTSKDGSKTDRLAYDKEQQEIRQAFLQSASGDQEGSSSEDGDGEDGFMVVKRRAKGGSDDKDDEQFQLEVAKMEESMNDSKKKSSLVDPKGEIQDGDKFLLDFFKNRNWIDKNLDNDSDGGEMDEEEVPMKQQRSDSGNESDDSLDQLDKNDDFEARYNFRFEAAEAVGSQSGADFSNVSYARGQTMNTLRRQDDSRKQKRKARKERKEAERRAKEEQLKRLKNARRQEMENKLKEIKRVLGEVEDADGQSVGDAVVDEAAILKMMEGDYDPEKLEKQMEEAFGDEFYEKQDAKWKTDQDVRSDLEKDEEGALLVGDEGQGDLYDNENEGGDDDHDFGGEDEGEEQEWVEEDEEAFGDEEEARSESELEKKIKSKMQDELYKMDYEDIIAGMPTRFKYRQVEPNNYGLSTQEILSARDSSLRQYVSLKKMAPYREDGEYMVGRKKRRMFREQLQHDLEENEKQAASASQPQIADDPTKPIDTDTPADDGTKKKKRRRSKKGKKHKDSDGKEEETPAAETSADTKESAGAAKMNESTEEPPKKRKRRRKKSNKSDETHAGSENPVVKSSKAPAEPDSAAPENATKADEAGAHAHSKTRTKKSSSKKKKKEKKKQDQLGGITASRLASYGVKQS